MRRSQSRGSSSDYALLDNPDEDINEGHDSGASLERTRQTSNNRSSSSTPPLRVQSVGTSDYHLSTDIDSAPRSPRGPQALQMEKEPPKKRTRFLDRQGPFFQSLGRLNVKRTNQPRVMARRDWVHGLMHKNTFFLLIVCGITYTTAFLFFSPFYYIISKPCGLKITTPGEAIFFSLETMVTVGYGAETTYWKGCWQGTVLLAIESVTSILLDAVIIGFFFQRLIRPSQRAQTILFSNKAVIQEIRGYYYLIFQVCEMRKHQLVEAHVRCYGVRHSPSLSTQAMRLQRPDDELGGMLLLALPTFVVHRIDQWSPLAPWGLSEGSSEHHNPSIDYRFPDVPQRSCDIESGVRDHFHAQEAVANGKDPFRGRVTRDLIERWLEKSSSEVLCVLEGVDSLTASTVQARHSYNIEDIEWDQAFVPCAFSDPEGGCSIDFQKFHETKPVNELNEGRPSVERGLSIISHA
mmetsp:Transcript_2714/g.5821  ORF Transcript_2714/g.5821 Transcript_2714/m.5821 type:complete len:464 (+) Transcript_2714:135-1526(+)